MAMDSNNTNTNTLLGLIREERARRQAQGASHVVLFRWGKTDEEWEAEIAEKRRSGEIGQNTVVIPYVWDGPPIPKRLV